MRFSMHISSLTALAALLLTPVSGHDVGRARLDEGGHLDPRDLVGHARFGLGEAIGRALKLQPGRAVEAELEGEIDDGKATIFFEVMIITPEGGIAEVRLDPGTGERLQHEAEEDENEEIPGFVRALRHAELDLATLVGKAEAVVKGFPVKAALEFEHGNPVCDVVVANTRWLIDVDLEARAGHLREIELEKEHSRARAEASEDEEHEKAHGKGKGGEDEDGEESKGRKQRKAKTGKDEEEEEDEGREKSAAAGHGHGKAK